MATNIIGKIQSGMSTASADLQKFGRYLSGTSVVDNRARNAAMSSKKGMQKKTMPKAAPRKAPMSNQSMKSAPHTTPKATGRYASDPYQGMAGYTP